MSKRLLFIEDTQEKARTVSEFIAAAHPEISMEVVQSFNAGWATLKTSPPELVIVDMSLPTFNQSLSEGGGRFRHFGGRELLDRMAAHKLKTKVCILTQYSRFGEKRDTTLPQLEKQLYSKYPELLVAVIFYNPAADEWKALLSKAFAKAQL